MHLHHFSSHFQDSIARLRRLHIINQYVQDGVVLFAVNKIFQENLHNALVGGGNHTSFGKPSDSIDKHQPDTAFLDNYSKECWESVLHYLVGTPSDKKPKAILKLLEKSGLMTAAGGTARPNEDPDLRITSKGFQFLLQDINSQIWAFLLQYLEMSEQLNMELVEVLNFFFQLGSLEFGQDYSVDALTETQKSMLDDLKPLGLVFQRKRKSTRFYPTRLATSLTSGVSALAESDIEGFIIVETNYRVYAYTNSPLQIAILSLFISMNVRFANVVIGMITRESVREALAKGISADQIIAYLTTHAHPEMRKMLAAHPYSYPEQTPVLPSTIIDQIRLWEMERNRLRASRSFLYKSFQNEQEYKDTLRHATEFGFALWYSDKKRMIAVSAEGHEPLKSFFQRRQQMQHQTH
eukprot:jgi/Hompol1/2749/HPOL_000638-RA